MEYKDTLNLPKTDFPMKANLPNREPDILKSWARHSVFQKALDQSKKSKISSYRIAARQKNLIWVLNF